MGERERNRSYYDRNEGRFDRDDNRTRDWGSRDDYRRGQSSDYEQSQNYRGYRTQEDRDNDYGARYTGSDSGRNSGYSGSSDYSGRSGGSYGDTQRDWERDRSFGYTSNRDWNNRDQHNAQSSYSERNRPFGFDRNYARNSTSGYGEGLYEGSEWSRTPTQSYGQNYGQNYGQRDASQRDWVERAYGSEGYRAGSGYGGYGGGSAGYGGEYGNRYSGRNNDDSFGQQLRDVGNQVARRVKRAFKGPKGYKRSDERVREDVNDRLAQQYEIDPSEIEVAVSNGEVTLTGTVQSRHAKFYAEEIADDVSGVNEVHNNLRVRREQQGTQSQTQTQTGSEYNASNQNTADAARRRTA
jgi:osmotically-inducible protein OsmY